jgi:Asp-tRNA(Asn)/Glu-tRNA(Gln) amidotransferase A subunit family amidase
MDSNLLDQSLVAPRKAIARREITSVDIVQAALGRIARFDPELHALVTVDEGGARSATAQADWKIVTLAP